MCKLVATKPKAVVEPDKRSAWLRKLDEECLYQVVVPRQQLIDDSESLDFLLAHVGWFDMYAEDDYAAFVRLLLRSLADAEIFRACFEPEIEHLQARRVIALVPACSGLASARSPLARATAHAASTAGRTRSGPRPSESAGLTELFSSSVSQWKPVTTIRADCEFAIK
jgi:hypothetical protein